MDDAEIRRFVSGEVDRRLFSFPHPLAQHGRTHRVGGPDALPWDSIGGVLGPEGHIKLYWDSFQVRHYIY